MGKASKNILRQKINYERINSGMFADRNRCIIQRAVEGQGIRTYGGLVRYVNDHKGDIAGMPGLGPMNARGLMEHLYDLGLRLS